MRSCTEVLAAAMDDVFLESTEQTPPLAAPDTFASVARHLGTLDLLACAISCAAFRKLVDDYLCQTNTLDLRSTDIGDKSLLALVQRRLLAGCVRLNVSDCPQLSKVSVVRAVALCAMLKELVAHRIGPGSWQVGQVCRLLTAAPETLRTVELDCRLAVNVDLSSGSPLGKLPNS